MSNVKQGKISLYAAGGCGINVASYFETYRGKADPGFALIEPVYIDTSRSNINGAVDNEYAYVVGELDGSGKVRAENHIQIGECVLDILQKHRPGDVNVVISSASGGSGSVIAPSLVSELLNRNVPTIVIIVGSTDSRIELENTIRTLKSYEAIAQLRKAPVVSMYFENSIDSPRKSVDADIHTAIVLMAALFSRQNLELDSADLQNWLRYTKVTGYDPHLANLEFFSKVIKLEKPASIISVATLGIDGGVTSAGMQVEYQCVGYMNVGVNDKIKIDSPIHAVVLDGVFSQIHKRLDGDLQKLDEARQARINKTSILSEKDKPTQSGLVL